MKEMKTLNGYEVVDAKAREDIANISTREIPTKTSQLENDSNFISSTENIVLTDVAQAITAEKWFADPVSFWSTVGVSGDANFLSTATFKNIRITGSITDDTNTLATKTYVDNAVANIPTGGGGSSSGGGMNSMTYWNGYDGLYVETSPSNYMIDVSFFDINTTPLLSMAFSVDSDYTNYSYVLLTRIDNVTYKGSCMVMDSNGGLHQLYFMLYEGSLEIYTVPQTPDSSLTINILNITSIYNG